MDAAIKKTVVVTGAGGFAGGYIARYLDARGHSVTATVRKASAAFPETIRVVAGDLTSPGLITGEFDALIHCAAEIPARCPDGEKLYAANVEAAATLFRAAASAGAETVVFMSSMSHYGQISVPVVTEDLDPKDPDLYGRSKTEGERRLAATVSRGELPSGLSIRLPGTVGRQSHDNFLSNAYAQAARGDRLTVRNPDAPFNNIVFIGDLAHFLDQWIAAPKPGYAVTNLAPPTPVTVHEVFITLLASLGRPEDVELETSGKPPFVISTTVSTSLGYKPLGVLDSVRAFVEDSSAETDDVAKMRALRDPALRLETSD